MCAVGKPPPQVDSYLAKRAEKKEGKLAAVTAEDGTPKKKEKRKRDTGAQDDEGAPGASGDATESSSGRRDGKRKRAEAPDDRRDILPPHKLVLAPMVGGSELAFRMLCRRYGAELWQVILADFAERRCQAG